MGQREDAIREDQAGQAVQAVVERVEHGQRLAKEMNAKGVRKQLLIPELFKDVIDESQTGPFDIVNDSGQVKGVYIGQREFDEMLKIVNRSKAQEEERKKTCASCYLLGLMDTTQEPPVLVGFRLSGSPAGATTTDVRKQRAFDFGEIKASSFSEAKEEFLKILRDKDYYRYSGQMWMKPFIDQMLKYEG